jgi:hypothetical protein
MNPLRVLIGLAVLQTGLAAWTWMPGRTVAVDMAPVLSAAVDSVTRIQIETSGESPDMVALEREGSGWVVASADRYPAVTQEVVDMLDALRSLQRQPTAVAGQASSHAPLGVAEEDYERRIQVTSNGETSTYYLGSGAGSSVHIRLSDEQQVFRARGASVSDFPASAGGYVDTAWLSVPKDQVVELSITNAEGELDFRRQEDAWLLAQLNSGHQVKQSELDRILDRLASLTMTEPVAHSGADFGQPGTTVEWVLQDGTRGSLQIGAQRDGSWLARRSGSTHDVLLSAWATEVLRDASYSVVTEAAPASLSIGSADGAGVEVSPATPGPVVP